MSLLTIVQDAFSEIGSLQQPSSIVNNPDLSAQKALAMLNGIGRDLNRSYEWPMLKCSPSYTFSTVNGQSNYPLPSDFRRFAPMSHWDRTSHWPLMGAATDTFWQLLKSGFVTFGMRFWFRVEGSNFVMAPTPTDVRTIAFDYFKTTWASSSGGTPQTKFQADTDTVNFLPNNEGEELMRMGLIYKWKASNGLPYADDKANFLDAADAAGRDASPPPLIDVTGIPRLTISKGLIPDTGYGA